MQCVHFIDAEKLKLKMASFACLNVNILKTCNAEKNCRNLSNQLLKCHGDIYMCIMLKLYLIQLSEQVQLKPHIQRPLVAERHSSWV